MVANKKYVVKLKALKNASESGYAMVVVLGIVILTLGILSSMTLLTVTDVKNSTKNRGVLEARIASESVLDTVYAAVNVNGSKDIVTALEAFKNTDTGLKIINLDRIESSPPSVDGVAKTNYKWSGFDYAIDSNGNIISCPVDFSLPCFKIRLIKVETNPGYSSDIFGTNTTEIQAIRTDYVIDIVMRTRCDSGTTNNCSYSRVQQNLSLRKYVEYISLSNVEDVAQRVLQSAPSSPAVDGVHSATNYYSGEDKVDGNIHTNAGVIKACDGFNNGVSKWITANSASSLNSSDPIEGVHSNISACATGPIAGGDNSPKLAKRAELSLPDRVADTSAAGLKAIAENDGNQYVLRRSEPSIVFRDNGTFLVDNDPSPIQMPPSGVLFLQEGGSISGTVKGKITIASPIGEDITIAGNLEYKDSSPTSKDILGVYSGRDIKIACNPVPASSACAPITVHGFLKANTDLSNNSNLGTIYNPSWATAITTPGNAPAFTLYGAMESYYRGTFGAMDSQSPNVKSGFKKNFTFDERLRYEQPPFMLRDGTIPFIRSIVKDVPCADFCQ